MALSVDRRAVLAGARLAVIVAVPAIVLGQALGSAGAAIPPLQLPAGEPGALVADQGPQLLLVEVDLVRIVELVAVDQLELAAALLAKSE